MRTFIYVDGFNLYYRALKHDNSLKWLDIKKLCQSILSQENSILRINYYSARVSDKIKVGTSKRQHSYIRALETIPEMRIHMGNFLVKPKTAKLVEPIGGIRYAKFFNIEEKGSDVNLATHMVLDACKDRYDVAVVISNDTDLVEPIRVVKEELGKVVGIICPAEKIAESLKKIPPSFVRYISRNKLKKAQFPNYIGNTGIKKPNKWWSN